MIIGFLGKGGSGKSTCSTLMTNFLHDQGNLVLAIDADHNMDLAYNLSPTIDVKPIGGTFSELKEKIGIDPKDKLDNFYINKLSDLRFAINPKDDYTNEYTVEIKPNLHLMISGPQNEDVLYGSHCSHSLAAPLKIYLPLLNLKENEFVVIDEKASVDAVSTGIPTGFDLAVVVSEPREHSVRVAKQITDLLEWYEVPYITLLNKYKLITDNKLIIDMIVSLGKLFQLKVVAEGVENQSHFDLFQEYPEVIMQGYHLHKPEPASDWIKKLK